MWQGDPLASSVTWDLEGLNDLPGFLPTLRYHDLILHKMWWCPYEGDWSKVAECKKGRIEKGETCARELWQSKPLGCDILIFLATQGINPGMSSSSYPATVSLLPPKADLPRGAWPSLSSPGLGPLCTFNLFLFRTLPIQMYRSSTKQQQQWQQQGAY